MTISSIRKRDGRLMPFDEEKIVHAINNTRYVSNETKEKVYQAIAELG